MANTNDLKTLSTIIIPLLVFCGVFSIQILNGFQKDIGSLIVIALSVIIALTFWIAIISYNKDEKNIFTNYLKASLIILTLLCCVFFVLGCYIQFIDEEVTFDYPENGDPVPINISMSGEYRNINNTTDIWIYTYTNKSYFLESTKKIPNGPGDDNGRWEAQDAVIGSDEKLEEGNFFILGFLLVDHSQYENYNQTAYENREKGLSCLPLNYYKKLGNITVFRIFTYS